jgi:hypothetical protein
VLGGASEPEELWARTRAIVAGLAAQHGIVAVVANREEEGFAGGGGAWAADGRELDLVAPDDPADLVAPDDRAELVAADDPADLVAPRPSFVDLEIG